MNESKSNRIWTNIITRVMSGENNVTSPFDSEGVMESLFITFDENNRVGWGRIWCSKTHKGIHLSRVEVPDTVRSVFTDDFKPGSMPDIDLVPPW